MCTMIHLFIHSNYSIIVRAALDQETIPGTHGARRENTPYTRSSDLA